MASTRLKKLSYKKKRGDGLGGKEAKKKSGNA